MATAMAEREQRATARGAALVGRVERVARYVWAVPSQSDPHGLHVVSLVGGVLRCDCRAGEFGLPCAHAASVRLWVRARRRGIAA
jgi:hypothetical protein